MRINLPLWTLLGLILSFHSFAQVSDTQKIPNLELSVAAKDQENGKTGNSIYLFTLMTGQGECSLTTLRIRCESYSPTNRDKSFRPEIWHSSTRDGSLIVRNKSNQLDVSETLKDFVGETKSAYLFGYRRVQSSSSAITLTSFSGGSIMTIHAIKEVHTVNFVPFKGSEAFVQLDCNTLWLPGVDTTK
jgi:hypothetical protein